MIRYFVILQTESGSRYTLSLKPGKRHERVWMLRCHNVPNTTSMKIEPEREWPVTIGELRIGQPARLVSIHFHEREHPDRIPGGGKVTSPIKSITSMTLEEND